MWFFELGDDTVINLKHVTSIIFGEKGAMILFSNKQESFINKEDARLLKKIMDKLVINSEQGEK